MEREGAVVGNIAMMLPYPTCGDNIYLPPSPDGDCVHSHLLKADLPDETVAGIATIVSPFSELHAVLGSYQLWSERCEVDPREHGKPSLSAALGK